MNRNRRRGRPARGRRHVGEVRVRREEVDVRERPGGPVVAPGELLDWRPVR